MKNQKDFLGLLIVAILITDAFCLFCDDKFYDSSDASLWRNTCNTYVMDYGMYSNIAHRYKLCAFTCESEQYCIFYSYDQQLSQCFICIHFGGDFDGTFLGDVTWPYVNHKMIKHRFEDIMYPNTNCMTSNYPGNGGDPFLIQFNPNESRITGIQICTSDDHLEFNVAGFDVYINGNLHEDNTCIYSRTSPDPYPMVTFDEDELILGMDIYPRILHSWGSSLEAVYDIAIHTNRRSYGPFGAVSDSQIPQRYTGYNVVGFYGARGGVIDSLGFYFERC